MAVALAPATPGDIAFIMACERRPGYEPFVGRWDAEMHAAGLENPDWCYLVGTQDEAQKGFAVLQGLCDRRRNVLLKRIAVHDAGLGFGTPFLAALTDWVFSQTQAHRFWLEVVETNARARHVYRSLGWAEEGLVREAFDLDEGGRGNFVQMSILKSEWRR